MPSERVIWGPPGCGKTHAGMTLCREWADRGVAPDQIAYLAFTKAAAKAAATKIFETEDEARMSQEFPYFRTIHSLCYRALKKERSDLRLINTADMKQFAKLYSMSGTFAVHDWEDLADVYAKMKDHGRTEWDQAMSAYSFSRVKASTVEELDRAKREPAPEGAMMLGLESMGLDVYRTFVEKYEKFKKEDGLIDFGDMLEFGARDMKPLDDVRYAVLDECLPAGTKITMANGSTKLIEEIGLGEKIFGIDHRTGATSEATVIETREQDATELIILDDTLFLTPNHPVFVIGRGYVRAGDLKPGDRTIKVSWNEDMPAVWGEFSLPSCNNGNQNLLLKSLLEKVPSRETVCRSSLQALRHEKENAEEREESNPQILHQHLRRTMVKDGPRINRQTLGWFSEEIGESYKNSLQMRRLWDRKGSHSEANEKLQQHRKETILQQEMWSPYEIYAGRPSQAFRSPHREQSHEERSIQGKNEGNACENWPSSFHSRWEWKRYDKASRAIVRKAGLRVAARAGNEHEWGARLEVGKAGHFEPQAEDRYRMRRSFSQNKEAERNRPQKAKGTFWDGLDHIEIQESGNTGKSGHCFSAHTLRSVEKIRLNVRVYNIGTTTENYFADGTLVHNCQDLAPQHHLIIDRLFESAQEIWWAGDDDQSVFKFSGASAELFLERAKRATYQIQLRQTHRFGQQIVDFSRQIIERVKTRHPKDIIGVDGREGKISVSGSFEPIPGDVMILHRHVQGCQDVAQAYIDAGLPFRNERGRDPLDSLKRIKAWQTVRALSMGEEVSLSAAALVIENLLPSVIVGANMEKIRLVVHGRKSMLDELGRGSIDLRGLEVAKILTPDGAAVIRDREYHTMKHSQDLEYYERVDKNGYTVDVDPNDKIPRITTIHGSKGREASQTIVFSEMGQKCWEDFETEHRLAYVASTRTKGDMTICLENKVHWAEAAYDYPAEGRKIEEPNA